MQKHINELQQTLIRDDAYLPWIKQGFSAPVVDATLTASQGNPEPARNGANRPVGEDVHAWICRKNDWIAYLFRASEDVTEVTLVLDSGLDQNVALSYHQKDDQLTSPPEVMPKAFRIDGLIEDEWQELIRVDRNYQRFRRFALDHRLDGIRFVLEETWGAEETRVYAFYIN